MQCHKVHFHLGRERNGYICTEIDFDFGGRKWTDGQFFDSDQFIEKWKERFGQVWAIIGVNWPKHPYQPEYGVLGTDSFFMKIDSNWAKIRNFKNP